MLSLILTLILSLLISFLITMDASSATLHVGTTTISEIPLFYVVLSSIIIGVLLASVNTIVTLIKAKLTIFAKNKDLKKSYETVEQLQEEIDKLEEDKITLREKLKELRSKKDQI